ncbi:hypothetical protein BH11PSE11_BH11PSE11_31350 [soil metagenome]
MARTTRKNNLLVYGVSVVAALIAAGFGASWYFLDPAKPAYEKPDISYLLFGPINIQMQGIGTRTSIAVQTRTKHSAWIVQNKSTLDGAFQKVLTDIEPDTVLTDTGLKNLQGSLKEAGNTVLATKDIDAVVVTDLLIVRD